VCDPANEGAALDEITKRSTPFGTQLGIHGDEVSIAL
jgi:hypothetical protein